MQKTTAVTKKDTRHDDVHKTTVNNIFFAGTVTM